MPTPRKLWQLSDRDDECNVLIRSILLRTWTQTRSEIRVWVFFFFSLPGFLLGVWSYLRCHLAGVCRLVLLVLCSGQVRLIGGTLKVRAFTQRFGENARVCEARADQTRCCSRRIRRGADWTLSCGVFIYLFGGGAIFFAFYILYLTCCTFL